MHVPRQIARVHVSHANHADSILPVQAEDKPVFDPSQTNQAEEDKEYDTGESGDQPNNESKESIAWGNDRRRLEILTR